MPLAGDDDGVARLGEIEGAGNGLAAVDDGVALLAAAMAVHAALDLFDDGLGRLAARIVGGGDHDIRQAGGPPTHPRSPASDAGPTTRQHADRGLPPVRA